MIVEFELEFEKGITIYEVTLFDEQNKRFIELIVNAQGKVIEQEYEQPELDEEDEVAAAKLMKQKTTACINCKVNKPSATIHLIESQQE
ncbi:PepSY domain-containing protein (plasmid) [Pseudoalteromonas espejiana]